MQKKKIMNKNYDLEITLSYSQYAHGSMKEQKV